MVKAVLRTVFIPVFCGDLMTGPVDVREQGSSARVGAAAGALVGPPAVFYVSL